MWRHCTVTAPSPGRTEAPEQAGPRPPRRPRPAAGLVEPGDGGSSPCPAPAAANQVPPPSLGPGRPHTRTQAVIADKAHSSHGHRAVLRQEGVTAVTPELVDQAPQRRRHGSCGGRTRASDPGETRGTRRSRPLDPSDRWRPDAGERAGLPPGRAQSVGNLPRFPGLTLSGQHPSSGHEPDRRTRARPRPAPSTPPGADVADERPSARIVRPVSSAASATAPAVSNGVARPGPPAHEAIDGRGAG